MDTVPAVQPPAKPHQRQFVLGPLPVKLNEDWRRIDVADGLVLSHCQGLPVSCVTSADGERFYLLGIAVSAIHADLESHFSTIASDQVDQTVAFWAGRWALVSANRCISDAGSLMGLYYRSVGERFWISTSPALLGDHLPHASRAPRIGWDVRPGRGMDWVPAPLSTREGVYKLLPQRALDPRSGEISVQRNLPADGPSLAECLQGLMAHWSLTPFRLKLVAVTAGLDTRTILAAAVASGGGGFETYTTLAPYTSDADRSLPPKLAASVSLPHRFIEEKRGNSEEIAESRKRLLEHIDHLENHPMIDNFALGGTLDTPDSCITHGAVFEVGRCYYWNKLRGFQGRPVEASALISRFFSERPAPYEWWLEGISRWLDSLREDVPLPMDWRDRFYLEQRVGSWASGLRLITDFGIGYTFYPGNCLWLVSRLLEPAEADRRLGLPQTSAIQAMTPALSKFPVNSRSLRERFRRGTTSVRHKIGRLSRRLR